MMRRLLMLVPCCIAACATLPDNTQRHASYADYDTHHTRLAQRLPSESRQDGLLLLESGLDALAARRALAQLAERSIDAQYYLYHDDLAGHIFTRSLLQAADRGVRVRLLVDDMDLEGRDPDLLVLDSHPQIEVRVFNPFRRGLSRWLQVLGNFGSITRRMHNKSFTVDGAATILGGRNIGNEYFDAHPNLEFADLDVLAVGPVAESVSQTFDLYWNYPLAYPITSLHPPDSVLESLSELRGRLDDLLAQPKAVEYLARLESTPLCRQLRENRVEYDWGEARVAVDHPDKLINPRDASELQLMSQLAPVFDEIERELIIVSPYFVPGRSGVELFKRLTERGVRVRILTNSLASNDVGVVHAGYARYRRELLRNGVELYELNQQLTRAQRKERKGRGGASKASLHAKIFILDRKRVFIGSLNLDPRSFFENTEIGLLLDAPQTAERMARSLEEDIEFDTYRVEMRSDELGSGQLFWHGLENGKPVTYEVDPHTSIWRRMGINLLRLLPFESQL